jgi:hypothetical protein
MEHFERDETEILIRYKSWGFQQVFFLFLLPFFNAHWHKIMGIFFLWKKQKELLICDVNMR